MMHVNAHHTATNETYDVLSDEDLALVVGGRRSHPFFSGLTIPLGSDRMEVHKLVTSLLNELATSLPNE